MTEAEASSNKTNTKEWNTQSRQLRKRKTANISLTSPPLPAPCVLSPKEEANDNLEEEPAEQQQESSTKGAKASGRPRRGRRPKVVSVTQKWDSPNDASSEREESTSEEKEDQCLVKSTKRGRRKMSADDTVVTHADVSSEDVLPESTELSAEEETKAPVVRATRSQTRKRAGAKIVAPRVLRKKK